MDPGLGLGQPSEHAGGFLLDVFRQIALVEDGLNFGQMATLRMLICTHNDIDFRGTEPILTHLLRLQFELKRQTSKQIGAPAVFLSQSGIHKSHPGSYHRRRLQCSQNRRSSWLVLLLAGQVASL